MLSSLVTSPPKGLQGQTKVRLLCYIVQDNEKKKHLIASVQHSSDTNMYGLSGNNK